MGATLPLSLDPALCSNAWKNTEVPTMTRRTQQQPWFMNTSECIIHLSPSTPSKALLVTPATLIKMYCRCPKQLYHSKDGQDHLFVQQHISCARRDWGERGAQSHPYRTHGTAEDINMEERTPCFSCPQETHEKQKTPPGVTRGDLEHAFRSGHRHL